MPSTGAGIRLAPATAGADLLRHGQDAWGAAVLKGKFGGQTIAKKLVG